MTEVATKLSVFVHVCVNHHQSTGQPLNVVSGTTNRSHSVTFVNVTLSSILIYTPGHPVFLFVPLCALLLTPFALPLSSLVSTLSNLCSFSRFSQQIMTRTAWRVRSLQQNNAVVRGRCRWHSHPQTMMDNKISCVLSEFCHVMLQVSVKLSLCGTTTCCLN